MERIVLAYSGDLVTSAAIPWLADHLRADVVTLTLDLGQGGELEDVRARALAMGALRAHVLDMRDQFARDYITPALRAGAMRDPGDPLAAALAQPLIARQLVTIAGVEGAAIVAHGGSTGAADRCGIDLGVTALNPAMRVVAPARSWDLSPARMIAAAKARGVSFASDPNVSANLWGRTVRSSAPDDTWQEIPEEVYVRTRPAAEAPDAPASIEIEFVNGVPVRLNGIEMTLVELIQSLETIAGAHSVGRSEMVAHRGGRAVRTVLESPAALPLHHAHLALQTLRVPADLDQLSREMGARYAALIENGGWHSPVRAALDAFVANVQAAVSGSVRLSLFKGACHVTGTRPPVTAAGPPSSTPFDRAAGSGLVKTPY